MKLFGLNITRNREEKQAGANIYGIRPYEIKSGLYESGISKEKLLQSYSSWVYACATKRAQSVASAKFRLYKRIGADDFRELDDHNALLVLERPNPNETRYQFLFRLIVHMDLTGDAYALVVRDRSQRIRELWTLQPDRMTIIPSNDGLVAGYSYKPDGVKEIRFRPEEIIHFRHPNPISPYYGASIVGAVAMSVDINDYQHDYQRNFYKGSAMPNVVLSTDSKLNKDTAERLRRDFLSVYGGSDGQKVAVLENGLKLTPFSINPKDLDWLAVNGKTIQEICAIFGVPPAMLGIVEDVNRANAESQEYTYAKMAVEPLLKNIDEQLTLDFVRNFQDGGKLFIQHDSTVPMDEQRQATAAKERILSGQNTINEERKLKGWDSIVGGDVILVPVNYMPLNQMVQRTVTQEGDPLQNNQAIVPSVNDNQVEEVEDDDLNDEELEGQ
jgi:HK97 family phage portal protein